MIALDPADVLERFSALSGLDGSGRFLPLCAGAATEIGAAEREGCGEEGRDALCAAAAALAFYRYALSHAGRGTEAFSAGDVKVSPGKTDPASARELWRNAAAAAAPYLRDSGCFLFGRIRP